MLRALILAVGLATCLTLRAAADDDDKKPDNKKRGQLTEEQKNIRKEIIAKYDKNKDGKLDAEERKAISAEDKEKLKAAGLGPRKEKKPETK